MNDLVFKQGISLEAGGIGFNKQSDGVLRITSGGLTLSPRDVVRIVYSDGFEKAVYGVATSSIEIAYDTNIYPVGLSTFTGYVFVYNSADVDSVSVYRIGVDVENGLYSKGYLQYKSTVFYSLIVPSKRNQYFGITDKIVTEPNVAFVDYCDNKAYGVGISEKSFDTLNNTFKSSLEFNIATR